MALEECNSSIRLTDKPVGSCVHFFYVHSHISHHTHLTRNDFRYVHRGRAFPISFRFSFLHLALALDGLIELFIFSSAFWSRDLRRYLATAMILSLMETTIILLVVSKYLKYILGEEGEEHVRKRNEVEYMINQEIKVVKTKYKHFSIFLPRYHLYLKHSSQLIPQDSTSSFAGKTRARLDLHNPPPRQPPPDA